MSSLRRLLSLECADASRPTLLFSSSSRKLARHSSLPDLLLFKSHGLPPLPSPSKSPQRTCKYGSDFSLPSRGCRQKGAHGKLTLCRSAPARRSDYECDICVQAVTRVPSRTDRLQMEDSVVYRELCESIGHLELPERIGCMVGSQAVCHASVEESCDSRHVDEKIVGLSSSYVRGRPLSLRRRKQGGSLNISVSLTKRQVNGPNSLERHCETGSRLLADSVQPNDGGNSLLSDVTGSVNCAIATLVFMMESLQEHTLRLGRALASEADVQLHSMLAKVHQEMQETFLWLFQRVFACTPRLMLLTMMLLVDFAAHSMGEHVALAVMPMGEPPTCILEGSLVTSPASIDGLTHLSRMNHMVSPTAHPHDTHICIEYRPCEGGAGDGVVRVVKLGGGMDGKPSPYGVNDGAAMSTKDELQVGLADAYETSVLGEYKLSKSEMGTSSCSNTEEQRILKTLWHQALSKESNAIPLTSARHILVAPVRAPALEADDYVCYDRTDLKYQQQLNRDPSNPLLLANYAQFLHVVRHDHDRAEELYKRAVEADPVDAELIGKYASFLWVARNNVKAADEAYKAAVAADPSNAYQAGNYAHFLWNSGAEGGDVPCTVPSHHPVSTS